MFDKNILDLLSRSAICAGSNCVHTGINGSACADRVFSGNPFAQCSADVRLRRTWRRIRRRRLRRR